MVVLRSVLWHWLVGHREKVSMTCISRSNDFDYSPLENIWCMNFGIMSRYDPTFDLKMNLSHCDMYFILPYILKTIWCMKIILLDYESVWHGIWPQNKFRSLWPIFQGPMILPYVLKTIWCIKIILLDYESVWHIWSQNKFRSLWLIFHGSVILLYILKIIWCMNIIFWDYKSV